MVRKFGWLVGLMLLVLVIIILRLGSVEAGWSPSDGMSWEATSFNGEKLFCYDRLTVEGSGRWKQEQVWVMRGVSSFYGGSTAYSDETIRLTKDLRLRVYEAGIKAVGADDYDRVVCEWLQDGYQYSFYRVIGGKEELMQRRKITVGSNRYHLYNQGVLPQLALLLESGRLSESERMSGLTDRPDIQESRTRW